MSQTTLDYNETLAQLLGLIGERVTVFVATHSVPPPPTRIAIMEGVLDRADESPVIKTAHADVGAAVGEHVVFKIGESSYFSVVRSAFTRTVVAQPGRLLLQFRNHDIVLFQDS